MTNIMLVDDSTTLRRIQRNIIEKLMTCTIVEASDGKDAIEKLKNFKPDLFFLDVNMPNMDGITLLKYLRSNAQYAGSKIVMCTSESEKTKIIETIKLGANSYIVKPFSPETLEQKLKDLKVI